MGVGAYLSLSGSGKEVGCGGGGRLFKARRLLLFSAFRMGANWRLGAYSNKYGKQQQHFEKRTPDLISRADYYNL